MSKMSDYLENKLFDHVLRNTTYTPPSAVYVSLHTTDPTDAGTGTEVSGGGYARQQVVFGAPSNGSGSNSAQVTFPEATADWGTITHFGIWDASSGGNLLFYGQLTTSKAITTGDQPVFKVGQLTVTLD